jgi:hypothetical protein
MSWTGKKAHRPCVIEAKNVKHLPLVVLWYIIMGFMFSPHLNTDILMLIGCASLLTHNPSGRAWLCIE